MHYTSLGRTGLKVSRLCLGTMNFGPVTPERESFEIMDRALDLGINFVDTANVYGGKKGEGVTESIVGRWLAQGGRRDRIVLATKVYGEMGEGPNERRLSAYHIRMACEQSLRRMQTDHIDLYQMHHVDRETPFEEIWQALNLLVEQGKVLYLGSSNFAGWHIAQANEIACRQGLLGLVSEQSKYSLMTRQIEREVLPACKQYGVGIIPWSPLEGGLLAGVLQDTGTGRRSKPEALKRIDQHRDLLETWEGLCEEWGEAPADMALAWLLHQEGVVAPIIGPRTTEHLQCALRALEIAFSAEQLKILDELFPPAGEAPEYYSW